MTKVLGTVTDKVNTTINYDIRTDDQKEDLLDFQERGEDFELVPRKFINLTPHTINNGTQYHPSGKVARVENKFSNFCCGISKVFYGEIFQSLKMVLTILFMVG